MQTCDRQPFLQQAHLAAAGQHEERLQSDSFRDIAVSGVTEREVTQAPAHIACGLLLLKTGGASMSACST